MFFAKFNPKKRIFFLIFLYFFNLSLTPKIISTNDNFMQSSKATTASRKQCLYICKRSFEAICVCFLYFRKKMNLSKQSICIDLLHKAHARAQQTIDTIIQQDKKKPRRQKPIKQQTNLTDRSKSQKNLGKTKNYAVTSSNVSRLHYFID